MLKTVVLRGLATSRRQFWTIAPLVAVVLTPAAALSGLLRQQVDTLPWTGVPADMVIAAAAVAISGLGYFFLAGAIAEVVVAERRGNVRRSFRALALAIPYATLIVVDLLVTGAITLGIELLVIPGLIVAARFGMAPVLIEVEHDGAGQSLRRSFDLSRGASYSVGAVLLAVLVLTTVLAVPLKHLAAEVFSDTLAEMVGLLLAGVLVKPLGAVIEVELALELIATADILLEGNRPGVMEKLGLGPDDCFARRPGLVYGRATGWGQDGPNASRAGHDINYIALSGVLWGTGRPDERPTPPLNLLGDYGGGGMMLAFGVVAALLESRVSGTGQVVDAAMLDGASLMSTLIWEMRARGLHADERGVNLLDTGAPFYEVYECADGKFVAVGALEPQFYAELCARTGFERDLAPDERRPQQDHASWPERKDAMARLFATRTRDEWTELLESTDACVAPVLSWAEAPEHPHNQARQTFPVLDGVRQPAPAPRFSRTPGAVQRPACAAGAHTTEILAELGLDADDRARMRGAGAFG